MILNDVCNFIENKVFPIRPANLLFNQYGDKDLSVDLPEADNIRKQNLVNYLKGFTKRPAIVLIGEAPGPRGCRFSGVPFTSESQLSNGELPFTGQKSSTSDLPHSENSATIFWRAMLPFYPKFFIWNSVPFHPHKHGEALSIRNPTRAEVSFYSDLLSETISLVKPKHIIAVGKKAESALRQKGYPCMYVRHPSHGGAKEFSTVIRKIFDNI